VDPRALVPRAETEHLVGLLLARCVPPPSRVLDLGTGTGAIALALAKAWPEVRVDAVDRSETALALARENAAAAGVFERVDLRLSDWFSGLAPGQKYGLIVSNPPYLTAEEIRTAAPEVRDHEPLGALDGGRDGIEALELILREAHGWLEPGALLALETGTAQHARLLALAESHGYVRAESLKDLTGRDRYVLAVV
jgi:release factor glutamine methyltransferase